jgi:hypothetical protein
VTNLIAIVAMLGTGFAVCYALLLWKLRSLLKERQLKTADQIGALDDAIRALETRLSEHQQSPGTEASRALAGSAAADPAAADDDRADLSEEGSEIPADIQVAVAAATVVALGPSAVVQSVTAVTSPWTQQGRVLVQGGHNLRVRR